MWTFFAEIAKRLWKMKSELSEEIQAIIDKNRKIVRNFSILFSILIIIDKFKIKIIILNNFRMRTIIIASFVDFATARSAENCRIRISRKIYRSMEVLQKCWFLKTVLRKDSVHVASSWSLSETILLSFIDSKEATVSSRRDRNSEKKCTSCSNSRLFTTELGKI